MDGITVAGLISLIGQLGFAAAAWRLATALRDRVENHEVRISVVEGVLGVAMSNAKED
jgi:predicted component of type VI protein secretion system